MMIHTPLWKIRRIRRLRYYIQKEEVGQGTEGMSMKG
jgi:hypothetical protein